MELHEILKQVEEEPPRRGIWVETIARASKSHMARIATTTRQKDARLVCTRTHDCKMIRNDLDLAIKREALNVKNEVNCDPEIIQP